MAVTQAIAAVDAADAPTERAHAPRVVLARERLRAFLAETGWSQARLGAAVGKSKAAVNGLLHANYNGDYGALAESVLGFLESAAPQPLPVVPEREREASRFVETAVTAQVRMAIEFARQMRDIGVVYGDPGLGKSATLERYRDERPAEVVMVTAAPHHRTAGGILCEVARAAGVPVPRHNVQVRTVWADLVRSLRGREMLLIVDEAQHLPLEALEELRSLHDATRVPLLLSGNDTVYNRLRGSGGTGFAQLFSRVALRVQVEGEFTLAQVEALVGDEVEDPEALRFLLTRANRPGALRTVSKLMRLARVFIAQPDMQAKYGGITRVVLEGVEARFLIPGA